jgi:predicted MPP superfamily phosphohydrolase
MTQTAADPATAPPAAPPAAPPPRRLSRRRFLKFCAGAATLPVAAGVYATQVEPFWPQYHQIDIPVRGLPAAFAGYRIAHLTDLHTGKVPISYLQRVMNHVRDLKPDLVLVTGDLVHHNPAMIGPVIKLLNSLQAPVVATFGNHEYGIDRGQDEPRDPALPEKLEAALTAAGHTALRNAAIPVRKGPETLWIVGMDDLWYGGFDETRAFADVPRGAISIAMSHNPDTAYRIATHHPALSLFGHTHGGQIRLPGYGALRLNITNQQFDWGLFELGTGKLYVSSGVGYIRRVRFCCRPEVPVFRLVAG